MWASAHQLRAEQVAETRLVQHPPVCCVQHVPARLHLDGWGGRAETLLCGVNVTLLVYDDFEVLHRLGERRQLGGRFSVEMDAEALELCEAMQLAQDRTTCVERESSSRLSGRALGLLQVQSEVRLEMSSERRQCGKLMGPSWSALSMHGLLLGRSSVSRFGQLERMWVRVMSLMLQLSRRSTRR